MLKFVEFCSGIGGMTAGLAAAGWKGLLAVDNDADAAAVYQLAHGSQFLQADIHSLEADDLPTGADVWVAGFPCQPFSSSGNRLGFSHRHGTVFEKIASLAAEHRPSALILENVEGMLTNRGGHTFALVLARLNELGYAAEWSLLDVRWFGPPQTRPRLFVVAHRLDHQRILRPLLDDLGRSLTQRSRGDLEELETRLRPAIGKARPCPPYAFGPVGSALSGSYVSFTYDRRDAAPTPAPSLASIVAPNLVDNAEMIRSVRYWSTDRGRGPTRPHLRTEPTSHCIGSSIGGAPLYALPLAAVRKTSARRAFLEHSTWHREEGGLLVMRLGPERATFLFGQHVDAIESALRRWPQGATRKYKLVGNMVAPVCAEAVGSALATGLKASAAAATAA